MTESNTNILALPYEIQKQIFENLSSKEVDVLLNTNTRYHTIWEEINNSIADKTIFDSAVDTIDDKINKYKNIREIIIRTMHSASAEEYRTYIEFALKQKKLRTLQMKNIVNFFPHIELPLDINLNNLTELNISFISNRSNVDRDNVYLFLQNAPNIEKFTYEGGQLSDARLVALASNNNIRTITWTNVGINNPRLFRRFFWNANLTKINIINTVFNNIDEVLSMIETIFIRIRNSLIIDDINLYFKHFQLSDEDYVRINQEFTQIADVRCNDFVGITNIVTPLLKQQFCSRFKFAYIRHMVHATPIIEDGTMEYLISDIFHQKYKSYCLHYSHSN